MLNNTIFFIKYHYLYELKGFFQHNQHNNQNKLFKLFWNGNCQMCQTTKNVLLHEMNITQAIGIRKIGGKNKWFV